MTSRSKTIRTLENEVEVLSTEVARLRLMVERCEGLKAFDSSPAPVPAASPQIVLPLAGQPLDVLPSIFQGAEGTTRLLKVLLETYPWLLPQPQPQQYSAPPTAAEAPAYYPQQAVRRQPSMEPQAVPSPLLQQRQQVPAVAKESVAPVVVTSEEEEPPLSPPAVRSAAPAASRGKAALQHVDSLNASSVAAIAPLAQYRMKPQTQQQTQQRQETKIRSAMLARGDWGNETDELDF